MFNRQQSGRKRSYQVRKTGVKDENIDRQITVIHSAIALKLVSANLKGDDAYIKQVLAVLEQRRDEGRMGYGAFLTWWSIMELIDQPDVFVAAIVEDSPRMRKLRRRTPFVGILTEEERQNALEQDSLGNLPDLKTLY
ncbi:hypothetical protein Q4575_12240 [Psychrosphaera sp. 1_MG-2023]|uniref:Integron gene cassette protein n=1 Tax=Psychrosphaera algicola TaxID=3023714 RepID=A0ABT5FH67_9GAMM|nr:MULTISPECIES: hypothetical protein [unclassified Psychrosphaera]MDC2890539.1 hypothetical protein [Psychrosphaera sp. G1-22]MDO6720178.1 hypothetical protein [Psychrosphaera sp. 1_MG-2023]